MPRPAPVSSSRGPPVMTALPSFPLDRERHGPPPTSAGFLTLSARCSSQWSPMVSAQFFCHRPPRLRDTSGVVAETICDRMNGPPCDGSLGSEDDRNRGRVGLSFASMRASFLAIGRAPRGRETRSRSSLTPFFLIRRETRPRPRGDPPTFGDFPSPLRLVAGNIKRNLLRRLVSPVSKKNVFPSARNAQRQRANCRGTPDRESSSFHIRPPAFAVGLASAPWPGVLGLPFSLAFSGPAREASAAAGQASFLAGPTREATPFNPSDLE